MRRDHTHNTKPVQDSSQTPGLYGVWGRCRGGMYCLRRIKLYKSDGKKHHKKRENISNLTIQYNKTRKNIPYFHSSHSVPIRRTRLIWCTECHLQIHYTLVNFSCSGDNKHAKNTVNRGNYTIVHAKLLRLDTLSWVLYAKCCLN